MDNPNTDRELGELRVMLQDLADRTRESFEEVEETLRKINERLDAGDKRFKSDDMARAEARGERRAVITLGAAAWAGILALGAFVLHYVPDLLRAWLVKS